MRMQTFITSRVKDDIYLMLVWMGLGVCKRLGGGFCLDVINGYLG